MMSARTTPLLRAIAIGCLLLLVFVFPLAHAARAQTDDTPVTGTAPDPFAPVPLTGTVGVIEPMTVYVTVPVTVEVPVTVPVPLAAPAPTMAEPLPLAAGGGVTTALPSILAGVAPDAAEGLATATIPGTVLRNSNLRGGPGTNYPIVGKAPAGTTVNVVEATADRTWYYLDGGNWIAAFLVELSAPLGPAEVWSVAPGQPAGVFTKVTTTLVTTVITTTVTTVDQDGTTIVTTTTTTSNPQAPGVEGPGASVPPTGLPGGSAPVAAAPLGPGVAAAPGAVILGPLTPTLVISQLLPTDVQSATLVSVVEGDVIQVDINGVREIVRYLGVDAPEVSQLGGATATAANRRLVEGEEILLQREQTDRDAQNRLLRHVYVVDRSVSNFFNGGFAGIYVNGQLVADGWAVPGAVNPDVSRTPELERWALDAARAGRGFWGGSGGADNAVFALTRVSAPLFSGPGADNGADAVLAVDAPLKVFGRSPDGAWVQVRTPRLDEGWVFVPQLNLTGAIGQLPVTSNTSGPTPVPQPGQALVAPGTPSLPGQQPAATPFPGQPALVTPFPGQPAPMPGSPDPFGGQPAPAPFGPTVIITANLRSGPGTLYPIVGTALAGAPITITARSADGTWLQSSNSTWIATGLVTNISASTLPQFDAPPTPIPTMPPEPTPVLVVPPGATAPTPTITPTPSPTPTPLGNPTPTFTPVPPTPLVRLIALDRGNEWVILYNDGTGTQDLSGWTLVSETGDQRCPLQGDLAPRESLRVWAQVGPDGFSCGFAEPIWENAGPDAAVLLNAYGDEVSRIQ